MHPDAIDMDGSTDDEAVFSLDSASTVMMTNNRQQSKEIIDLTTPQYIVSIDIGVQNCGVVIVRDDTVIMWQLLTIMDTDTPVTAHGAAASVIQHVNKMIRDHCLLSWNSVVLIEGQLQYIPGATNHAACRKNSIISACFHSVWKMKNFCTKPISATLVKNEFQLPDGRAKKKAAVRLVEDMVSGTSSARQISVSPAIAAEFNDATKKDDLADCFLQAMWGIGQSFDD